MLQLESFDGKRTAEFEFTVTIPTGNSGVVIGREDDIGVEYEIRDCDTAWEIQWWEFAFPGSNEVNAKVKKGSAAFEEEESQGEGAPNYAANYTVFRPGTGRSDLWTIRAGGIKGNQIRIAQDTAGDVVVTGRVLAVANR